MRAKGTKQGPAEFNLTRCFELMSALQKDIRRGNEVEAFHWASLLAKEQGNPGMALNRLEIIAHEDVGLADPTAVLFALRSIEDARRWLKAKKREWVLGLANAVCALARAPKSRLADHFWAAVQWRERHGWHPDVPDYALDRHTPAGRRMGRGVQHWLQEGAKLHPKADVYDPYADDAARLWAADEKAGRKSSFLEDRQ